MNILREYKADGIMHVISRGTEQYECMPSTFYCDIIVILLSSLLLHRRYYIVLADGTIVICFPEIADGMIDHPIIGGELQLHVLLHNRDWAGCVVHNIGAHAPHQRPAAKKQTMVT
jgi:hypothetical protein